MKTVCCKDCGMPYGGDNWLDTVLSNKQWLLIHPDGEGGILCANCIIKRAAKLNIFTHAMMELQCGGSHKLNPNMFSKYRIKIKGDAGIYDVWGIDMLNYSIMIYRACTYEWMPYEKVKEIWRVVGLGDAHEPEEADHA
jgi:hypothetical protein